MSLLLALALAASPAAPAPTPGPGAAAKADANPAAPAWGPKSATATAEKSEVRLGEPFTVQVDVRHDKGEAWSLKAGARLDPFQLRSVQSRTEPSDELEITHLTLELALFKLGPQTVPDLPLVATASHPSSAQAPHEFSLPGPTVKGVASPKSDGKKRDIRGPVPFKVTSFRVLLYALAAVAVLGLGLWGYRWWRHRPRREAIALAPPVPEDQLAMQSLSALEAEGLPARGRFKEFHLRLSEILRRYLGDRYGILGMDMTSEELYQAMARLPSEGLSLTDLSWICAQGDLAKFAKAAPTVDDCRQALQLVRQLVLRTRRAPALAPSPAPGRAA